MSTADFGKLIIDRSWLYWISESKGVAFVAPAPIMKPVSSVLEKIRQRRLQLGCRYFLFLKFISPHYLPMFWLVFCLAAQERRCCTIVAT